MERPAGGSVSLVSPADQHLSFNHRRSIDLDRSVSVDRTDGAAISPTTDHSDWVHDHHAGPIDLHEDVV